MLLDYLLSRDNFDISDKFTEILAEEYKIYLGPIPSRWKGDKMGLSFNKVSITNDKVVGHGKVEDSLTFIVTHAKTMTTMDVLKTISIGANMTVPVTEEKQCLSGWKVPDSTLQVKIEVFLSSHRQLPQVSLCILVIT